MAREMVPERVAETKVVVREPDRARELVKVLARAVEPDKVAVRARVVVENNNSIVVFI
ncbi:MAG: hypothetical protein ABIJ31_08130 [Pseudomonadota bacterium]